MKNRVDLRLFGCTDEELDDLEESQGFSFVNLGALNREEVAELLGGCDIFLDASQYQAFGCTGLEAMATGCAAILPKNCGTGEYAKDRENCMLVDTENREDVISAIEYLMDNKEFLTYIKQNGVKTSRLYSLKKAVYSEIFLFNQILNSCKSHN